MTDKDAAIADFRKAVARILDLGVEGLSNEAKIHLAQILSNDPGSLRVHIRLEPLTILAVTMAADRSIPPVKLFEIHGGIPEGATNH